MCGKPDYCGYTADGQVVRCMRVPSDHESNGGWIHRLKDPIPIAPPRLKRPPPERRSFAPLIQQWRNATTPEMIEQHAAELGVSADMLDALTACYAAAHTCWAYPMWSAGGTIIGVRLRNVAGEKWAVTGSRDGLFWPFADRPEDGVAYVCEGPTDTAAAATLGLWAIGRPSCHGATDHLIEAFRKLRIQRMVVIGDNDEAKRRPDGSLWYPGREGALALIRDVGLPYKLVLPPAKDIRKWVQDGATIATFRMIEEQQEWRMP